MSSGQKQLRGGNQARVHADQVVLVMAKQEGGTTMRRWPKSLKTKLNFMMGYQAQVNSGQMVLVIVSKGGWTALTAAKDAQERVGK